MATENHLNILNSADSTKASGINRRQLVRRVLAGAGAGVALPAFAAHPVTRHLADAATLAQADAKAEASEWKPEFLDPHQNETLIVLAERIVPGATKAQCNRFIDLMLSVDTRDNQQKFVNALSAFDGESLRRYNHPFKTLTEGQQNELLTAASTESSGQQETPKNYTWSGNPPKSTEPARVTLRDHFENIKGWVSGAYYSSEIGMRELGWDGTVMFPSFPGCQHPGGHQ